MWNFLVRLDLILAMRRKKIRWNRYYVHQNNFLFIICAVATDKKHLHNALVYYDDGFFLKYYFPFDVKFMKISRNDTSTLMKVVESFHYCRSGSLKIKIMNPPKTNWNLYMDISNQHPSSSLFFLAFYISKRLILYKNFPDF